MFGMTFFSWLLMNNLIIYWLRNQLQRTLEGFSFEDILFIFFLFIQKNVKGCQLFLSVRVEDSFPTQQDPQPIRYRSIRQDDITLVRLSSSIGRAITMWQYLETWQKCDIVIKSNLHVELLRFVGDFEFLDFEVFARQRNLRPQSEAVAQLSSTTSSFQIIRAKVGGEKTTPR